MQKEIDWLLREKYNNKPKREFFKDVERLKAGDPVDHVIGFTEFLGCKIDLSKKPLIPRPETEYWAGKAASVVLADKRTGIRCLDIFSGSACIAVAILAKTRILLCDIADSQVKCLKQAKINCQINKVSGKRYKIIKSDVFSNVLGKYDYIFANPPYIAETRIKKIQKSVLKFEPKSALFGGNDGLFYIKKFLKNAKNHLNERGVIFMEFDPLQKRSIKTLIKIYKYKNCEFYKDQFNRWRWVVVFK
jgi:release factor glutamine methyltransferase